MKLIRHSSVTGALKKMVGRKKFDKLILKTPDRRNIVSNAAALLHINEIELVKKLAKKLSLPFVMHLQSTKFLSHWTNKDEFETAGAYPYVLDGLLQGFCVTDPEIAKKLLPKASDYPLFLSPWAIISEALKCSNGDSAENRIDHKETGAPKSSSTQIEVLLTVLASELKKRGASCTHLYFSKEGASYQFKLEGGKMARGSINPAIKHSLYLKCEELSRTSGEEINGTFMRVEIIAPEKELVLRIGPQKAGLATDQISDADSLISTEPPSVRRVKILIVEDSPTFAKVLKRFFVRHGWEILEASNAQDANKILELEGKQLDCVVSDFHMPGASGEDFVRSLRQNPELRDLPVIILTSDEDPKVKLSVISSGVNAFVKKSENPQVLLGHIRGLLGNIERGNTEENAAA